jgi:hypothetical protein
LTAARRYCRLQDFTLAFGLALAATTTLSAPVPAIGVYQEIGLDPSPLQNLNPQAYLAQLRDLAPEPRPPATTSRSRGSIWRLARPSILSPATA